MMLREVETRARIVREAREWLRTPYHHHGRIKHVGVDCANLLCAVYEAAAAVPPVVLPHYPVDWHLHHSEELFLQWLAKVGAWPVQTPAPGDVAVFRFGRTFSHGAVMVESDLAVHAYVKAEVMLTRLHEAPLAGRERQFWAIVGPRPNDRSGAPA